MQQITISIASRVVSAGIVSDPDIHTIEMLVAATHGDDGIAEIETMKIFRVGVRPRWLWTCNSSWLRGVSCAPLGAVLRSVLVPCGVDIAVAIVIPNLRSGSVAGMLK